MKPFNKSLIQSQAQEREKLLGNNLTNIWAEKLKEKIMVLHD